MMLWSQWQSLLDFWCVLSGVSGPKQSARVANPAAYALEANEHLK